MRCPEFQRWLDEGRPEGAASEAVGHGEACADCETSLRAALELESSLARASSPAPPGFADAVMARIHAAETARAHAPALTPPALPWWVRAAADPAVVLAFLLAALVVWGGRDWLAMAGRLSGWFPEGLSAGAVSRLLVPASLESPTVALCFALLLLPAVLWVSWQLYLWAERSAHA